MGLLEQALHSLPDEIREARWALRDREELMAAEVQKAQQLMDQVRAEAARMVDKTEIVRQSRLKAEADHRRRPRPGAAQMINQSEDFIDGKLGGFEIVLERLLKTAHSGRERLSAQGLPDTMLTGELPAEDFLSPAPLAEYADSDRARGLVLRPGLLLGGGRVLALPRPGRQTAARRTHNARARLRGAL